MTNKPTTSSGHALQRSKSQKARLHTIMRASLYLNGALILLTYLPIPAFLAEALAWAALAISLIGIGSTLALWRLDCKQ